MILWSEKKLFFIINVCSKKDKQENDTCLYLAFEKYLYTSGISLMLDKWYESCLCVWVWMEERETLDELEFKVDPTM